MRLSNPGSIVMTPTRPRVALVGNAPLQYDQSGQIDSCDIVIRCNEAKTLGKNTGTRTDILCVNNSGEPAVRFISRKLLRKEPNFPQLREIWFARPYAAGIDIALKILMANDLSDLPVKYFSISISERAYDELRKHCQMENKHPSTGLLAFLYILEQEAFAEFDKYIFGFTFNMWYGHPEKAEMKVMESFCHKRQDLFFVPASPLWKFQRVFKPVYIYNLGQKLLNKLRSYSLFMLP